MSNSSKLNDLEIARLLEDDDEISEVDDEIADPDFCIQESDADDEISIEDEAGSEFDVIIDEIGQSIAEENGKPAIIADYNNTKGGVDELDKKCSIYSCSRRTRRWPLAIFYRLLDICAANPYVIYQSCDEFDAKSRADFLKNLGRQLVLPHLQRREHNQRLPKLLRDNISSILGPDSATPPPVEPTTVARKLCYICPSRLKRKTTHVCLFCSKPMCMGCSKRVCVNCSCKELDE